MIDLAVVCQDVVRGDGQGRVTLELVRGLLEAGHRVTVYAHRVDPDLRGAGAGDDESLRWHRIPRLPGPQAFDDVWFAVAASRSVRSGGHDATCVVGACAIPREPFIVYAHFSHDGWRRTWSGAAKPRWHHRVHSRLMAALEHCAIRRAKHVVACSRAVASELGVPCDRRSVVPNGIDLDEFSVVDDGRRAAARRLFDVPHDAFILAFIGEYRTGRKGLDTLLAALGLGPDDEHLLVAGDGAPSTFRRVIGSDEALARVHALGRTSATVVLAAADVVVVPSRYEPFSVVALEAAASGLPVVLSARAGAADYLSAASLVVDPVDDPVALRGAIDRLRHDDQLRRELGFRGRVVVESLDWSAVRGLAAHAVLAAVGGER